MGACNGDPLGRSVLWKAWLLATRPGSSHTEEVEAEAGPSGHGDLLKKTTGKTTQNTLGNFVWQPSRIRVRV